MSLTVPSVGWPFSTLLILSTATCVIYDHITTLDKEVELLWKRRKWTRIQLLFLINRYVGDGMQIYGAVSFAQHIGLNTTRNCSLMTTLVGYLSGLVAASTQVITIYRIASMYNKERKITVVLFSAFTLEWLAVLVITILSHEIKVSVLNPPPGVQSCPHPAWMYNYTMWIPVACFELLVLGLALPPAIEYYSSTPSLQSLESSSLSLYPNVNSLAYILLRDSVTFPFISMAVCILNLILFTHFPSLIEAGLCISGFSPCIVGPRLILNLREAYYQPFLYECKQSSVVQHEDAQDGFRDDHNVDLLTEISVQG